MKNKIMKNIYIVILVIVINGLASCTKPEWNNPFDTNYDSPISGLTLERTGIDQVNLNWDYNCDVSGGQLFIDKMVNSGEYNLDFAIITIGDTTWTDNQLDVNYTYKYRLRSIFDLNETELETVSIYNDIPAPDNFNIEIFYSGSLSLSWENSLNGFSGYKIFKKIDSGSWNDYATINNDATVGWIDYNFDYGSNYYYKVLAFLDDAYSDCSNELNIQAYQMVWDNGDYAGSIGGVGVVDFDVAIRFNTSDLAPYAGMYLTQIDFIPCASSCEYSIKVWTGGDVSGGTGNAGSKIIEQLVESPSITHWNYIKLENPVYIDPSKELWFGYRCNTQFGYPAGYAEESAIAWKGDLINWYGNWQRPLEWGSEFDFNWNIRGVTNTSELIFEE